MTRWTNLSQSELAAKGHKNRASWKQVKPITYLGSTRQANGEWTVDKQPKKPAKTRARAAQFVPSEHDEQKAVVDWFNASAASYGLDPRLLIAIPNGSMLAGDARMRSIQARRLKDEGVRAGAPDLFLALASTPFPRQGNYNGMFIELKRSGWKPPGAGAKAEHWRKQCWFHQMLRNQGYSVMVCAGAETAMAAIKDYLR